MSSFGPTNILESAEWQEARSRVEDYLLALHLTDPGQEQRIVATVLQRAAGKYSQNPAQNPTFLAMREMREALDEWFGKLVSAAENVAVPRLLFCLALEAAEKWPALFLAAEVPAHVKRAWSAAEVQAAPELKVSNMVPPPFDHALQNVMNLPAAAGGLTKNRPPSLAARAAALAGSGLALWTGKPR